MDETHAATTARMRAGRLAQILERADRIDAALADIRELVARMERDNTEPDTGQRPTGWSVTSACWPNPPAPPGQ